MIYDIVVEPSCDIHTTINTIGAQEVNLKVCSRTRLTDSDAETLGYDYELDDITSQCTFQFHPSGANGSIIDGSFSATNPIIKAASSTKGSCFIAITYVDPSNSETHYIIVKVTIHDNLDAWWFGQDAVIIPEDNRTTYSQVSVYGLFDADSDNIGYIEDITGHEYVNIVPESNATNFINVDNYGRIKIIDSAENPGTTKLIGSASNTSITESSTPEINVEVLKFNETLLKRFPHPRAKAQSHEENHNLLVVGEGFPNEEKFKKVILEVTKDIFHSLGRHSPFNHLAGDINVWSLFQASTVYEEGITFCRPIDRSRMSPTQNSDDLNLMNSMNALFQTGTSHLGLCFGGEPIEDEEGYYKGGRKGDKKSFKTAVRPIPAPEDFETHWENSNLGTLLGDPRRYSPFLDWKRTLMRYFTGTIVEKNAIKLNVGETWKKSKTGIGESYKKDFQFIGIVIYDFWFRAWNDREGFFLLPVVSHHEKIESNIDPTELKKKIFGELIIENNKIWKLTRRLPKDKTQSQTPPKPPKQVLGMNMDNWEYCKDTFVHEWGHSFNLGDEYEDIAEHAPSSTHHWADNLMYLAELRSSNSASPSPLPYNFDVNKIKWAKLPRMEKAHKIIQDAEIIPVTSTPGTYSISIKVSGTPNWIDVGKPLQIMIYLPSTDNNLKQLRPFPLILRNLKYLSTNGANVNLRIADEAVDGIENFPKSSAGTINLPGPNSSTYYFIPSGSVFYQPKRLPPDPNEFLYIMDQLVIDYIDHSDLPLDNHDNTTCDIAVDQNSSPESPPTGLISSLVSGTDGGVGGTTYSYSDKIIGIYEGGGHYTCNVFRPAGHCKMRTQWEQRELINVVPHKGESAFCPVCKYLIVNRINPSKHVEMDEDYSLKKK